MATISGRGGTPNMRATSWLNCDERSYPTAKAGLRLWLRSATLAPERRWICLTAQNRPAVGYASFSCENLSPYRKMSHLDDRAKRTATLHAAEKRTLEMIANGANLSDVLNELCAAIDTHSSGTSFVCLMDQAGNQLLPIAGPHLPSAFARAIDRLCKPTLAIQESFGRAADSGRWTGGFRHAGHLRRGISAGVCV